MGMIIDVFKDRRLFDEMEKYNWMIRAVCRGYRFANEGEHYDFSRRKVSYWFNPDMLWDLHISHHYPEKTHGLTKDKKFNLLFYFPNYVSLYLIDLLYRDRRDVTVEDQAGGDGRLFLYLKQLGFSKFHITEDFSQLCKSLLTDMMRMADVQYRLNESDSVSPEIINLVGWTQMTRGNWPVNTELACFYNNTRLVQVEGDVVSVRSNSGGYIPMPDFVPLCRDIDSLMNVFCRRDKYAEYAAKIAERGVIL